jgi:hypothetical protein
MSEVVGSQYLNPVTQWGIAKWWHSKNVIFSGHFLFDLLL